jgi:hypothetical protein
MVILKVKDSQGVVFGTIFATPPQEDRPGWLSVNLVRIGLSAEDAVEFYRVYGNALAIVRGDIKVAA